MGKIINVRNVSIGQGSPKICGTIVGKTEDEILELAQKAQEGNSDLIELRIDHYEDVLEIEKVKSLLRKVRRLIKKPIIFTLRRAEEGGEIKVNLKYYNSLLLMAAENSLADFIDVEMSALTEDDKLVDSIKAEDAYVIMSKHDFNKTPSKDEILRSLKLMEKKGADIAKVAFMPNSKRDVVNLIDATEEFTSNVSGIPAVAISMGNLGMISRIIGEFLDSVITFASLSKSSAPGQLSVDQVRQVLEIIHENCKRVFIVGFFGCGKTSVASTLSLKCGMKKVDMDSYIEQREQMTMTDLYNASESILRNKESKYLKQIIKKNYQIISVGSGSVMLNDNVELMKEKGTIVFLRTKSETIVKRMLNDSTRSLFGENFDLDSINELIKNNDIVCTRAADIIVDTDEKSIDEVCMEIISKLGFNA